MDSINFTANHIRNVTIAKKYYNKYKPCKVSLVEMDAASKRDMKVISDTADKWDISFTCFTYEDMVKAHSDPDEFDKLKVYALTKQKSNFDKMRYSDILGVIEVRKGYEDGNKIEVLQTNPKFIKEKRNPFPVFKRIGEKLTKYVKREFRKDPLYVHPAKTAIPFYEKFGFRKSKEASNRWDILPKS